MSSINIFRRSAIGLVVLGIASVSFAGTILGTALNGVFVGGEGLDLQARNGDLDYVTIFPATDTASFQTNNISPQYSWGWKVWGGLKFCGNEDVTVGWQRFYNNRTDVTIPAVVDGSTNPTIPRFLPINAWDSITGHVNFKLNEGWGVFGHSFNMAAWTFRLAGGVEWAKIQSNFTVQAFNTDELFGYENTSKTSGWGPRGEMDVVYHLPYNVALFANTNLALIVASRESNLYSLNFSNGAFPDSVYSNRHIVVPKVGMRLGVGYGYTFGMGGGEGASAMMTTIAVAIGWQVESYIHAIERNTNESPLTSLNSDTKLSNFGDSGLFLGVKVSADWV